MRRHDLPGPGEALHGGPETTPRQAATVIVLRGGDEALEVMLVQRTPKARFMGGAWVFPGGAVEAHEGDGEAAHRAAAVRELEEEAGVAGVSPAELVPFSRWITPAQVKIRYDTHFFLAEMPAGARPQIDGAEVVDLRWMAPRAALAAFERDEMLLVFPTIKHLEQLARFSTSTALLAHARANEDAVGPVQPRIRTTAGRRHVVLPGEPGYDDDAAAAAGGPPAAA